MSGNRKTYARRRSSRERTSYEGCVRRTLQFKLFVRIPSLHSRKSHGRRRNRAADRRSWLTAANIMETKLGAAGNPAEAWQAARRATRRPPTTNPQEYLLSHLRQGLRRRRQTSRSVRSKDTPTPSAQSSDALIVKGRGTLPRSTRTSKRV